MAAKQRTVLVITGNRAEFGLLEPVMRAIKDHRALQLHTVVAGTHLTQKTWRDVKNAGFDIDAKVVMQKQNETGRWADVQALGRGVGGFGRVFAEWKPDVVMVLGDRIEVLAAASAASVGGIHVAHIHGGDRAEGVADEAMRHAVSKMAHLHFAATRQSRTRLIRMGEDPAWVFNVGSPAMDNLNTVEPADDSPDLIVIQHPIGESNKQEQLWMQQTLTATRSAGRRLLLAPNHDPGSDGIRATLARAKCHIIDHLPRHRFLSLLAGAKAIVGNSSAGLIEAAALRVPCVNIGPRQAGRQHAGNVVACDYGTKAVRTALTQAMKLELRRLGHPYGRGQTGLHIADRLATINLAAIPLRKQNRY